MSLPATMRAVEIAGPGGPEVLRLAERPVPQPGPGQVLVAVSHAGVNRPDVLQRLGNYPPPPGASDIPGLEIAGTVVAAGEGAAALAGRTVCALVTGGGYAEYCLAQAGHCLPVPPGLSLAEAAALPETLFTVWHNVFERGGGGAGETLLVHGGTSGIGTMAIMLGKAVGLTVIATAGSAAKCAAMRKRLTLTGSTLRARSNEFKALLADEIARTAWPLVTDGEIRPVMDQTFPLAEVAEAHRRMEQGEHIGKIVLQVAGD